MIMINMMMINMVIMMINMVMKVINMMMINMINDDDNDVDDDDILPFRARQKNFFNQVNIVQLNCNLHGFRISIKFPVNP